MEHFGIGLETGEEVGAEDVLDLGDSVLGVLNRRDEDGAEARHVFLVVGRVEERVVFSQCFFGFIHCGIANRIRNGWIGRE